MGLIIGIIIAILLLGLLFKLLKIAIIIAPGGWRRHADLRTSSAGSC